MGVYARWNTLWFKFRGPPTPEHPRGEKRREPSRFKVGQEKEAEVAFRKLVASIAAGKDVFGPAKLTPHSINDFCESYFFPRRRKKIADWESDERRLVLHVLPVKLPDGKIFGEMLLKDVKPRHLGDLFEHIQDTGALAPKSIWNVYGVIKALFRDAKFKELVDSSPCILTKEHLGENVDADPEWRENALFLREELETLISDPRIPADWQVVYAIKGIGAARNGEACALRWRNWETSFANPKTKELGKLIIGRSHENDHTKTSRGRGMPVHPLLAAMLAEWKLHGWPKMMGRNPTPDDLIIPMGPPEARMRAIPGVLDYPPAPPVTEAIPGQVLTVAQVAERWGRSPAAVANWIRKGLLRTSKVPADCTKRQTTTLILRTDLELFLRARAEAPHAGFGNREPVSAEYPEVEAPTALIPGEVLGVVEAAAHAGVSISTFHAWTSAKKLRIFYTQVPMEHRAWMHLIRVADLELFEREVLEPSKANNFGRGCRAEAGSMRTNAIVDKQFKKDLQMLGFRHRRGHDLRSTVITLAQVDGGVQAILEACTHTPKSAKAISGYSRFPWTAKSAEVAKLQLARKSHRNTEVASLPLAAGDLGTGGAQVTFNYLETLDKTNGGGGNRTRPSALEGSGVGGSPEVAYADIAPSSPVLQLVPGGVDGSRRASTCAPVPTLSPEASAALLVTLERLRDAQGSAERTELDQAIDLLRGGR